MNGKEIVALTNAWHNHQSIMIELKDGRIIYGPITWVTGEDVDIEFRGCREAYDFADIVFLTHLTGRTCRPEVK